MLRRGTTLIEVLVALALGAIVLGTATTSYLRQHQGNTHVRGLTDAERQLAASVAVLGEQVGTLDRGTDLVVGQATDTSFQARSPTATSLVCASGGGTVTLAHDTSTVPVTGLVSTPKVGDSLWWRGDSSWSGALVTGVSSQGGSCVAPFGRLVASYRLALSLPDTIPVGTPLRITRQTRWSLYHASDGTWQLGFREASGIPAQFAASQPVVGPLVPRSGARRSGFRYFDDTGTELTPGAAFPVDRVARIRITAHALLPVRVATQDSVRSDSLDVALRHARGP